MVRIVSPPSPETAPERVWLPPHIQTRLAKLPSAVCTASREHVSLAWGGCFYISSVSVCVCVCPGAPVVPLHRTLCLNWVWKRDQPVVSANSLSLKVCLYMYVCVCVSVCMCSTSRKSHTNSTPAALATYLLCSQLGCR